MKHFQESLIPVTVRILLLLRRWIGFLLALVDLVVLLIVLDRGRRIVRRRRGERLTVSTRADALLTY